MDVVIVTGMSGSGKSQAADVLEDIGYFCIDNMPPQLLPKFMEICQKSGEEIEKIAVVADVRSGERLFMLKDYLTELDKQDIHAKILFIDCKDDVLIKRYKESRRKHPLASRTSGNLELAVTLERELLAPIKAIADFYIDTTFTTGTKFSEILRQTFLENVSDYMTVNCLSFGFKYGIPAEADLVFDVRCLPNPYYVPELKEKTGVDKVVRDYVMDSEESVEMKKKIDDFIEYMIPLYVKEGKSQLVVAFGCTGGKHRSVTFAENLYALLKEKDDKVTVTHRDIEKK